MNEKLLMNETSISLMNACKYCGYQEFLWQGEPEHQDVLKEEFGKDFQLNTSGSSQLPTGCSQIPPPTNQMSELQLVDNLNDTDNDRDVIGEAGELVIKRKRVVKYELSKLHS